jgi:protein-S-isoprenylcysteine O-methyltransferase Ste14
MALKEEFESSGNWLFRWRSYVPLVMVPVLLLAMHEYSLPAKNETLYHLWDAFCLLISSLGLVIRILTIGYTPKGTSGRNTKKQVAFTLNTTGMYSITRNPLYLGNFVIGLGFALLLYLWWLVVIYVLAFWLYYERIIFAEEEFLRSKFGDEYLNWADETPAFIPDFRKFSKAALRFSWKNVLKREYNGFLTIIATMFALKTVGGLFACGTLDFDKSWLVLLCLGMAVWVTFRTLKVHTTLLNEEGR